MGPLGGAGWFGKKWDFLGKKICEFDITYSCLTFGCFRVLSSGKKLLREGGQAVPIHHKKSWVPWMGKGSSGKSGTLLGKKYPN